MAAKKQLTQLQIISLLQFYANKRVAEWAADHGWSKMQVYCVIKGTRQNRQIRELIATTIRRTVDELWPDDGNKTAPPLDGALP
ncbi:MAG: hypothetical protein RBS34_11670 [Desulfofustis sp.]|jgi:hypothetical protein|nr:hypothetical protein [Desulfofustis sp.]